MRLVVAVLGTISILFVGFSAISESAQQAPDASNRSATANASYELATGVHEGIGQAGGDVLAWGGVAAIVVVALALLVVAGASGGRR